MAVPKKLPIRWMPDLHTSRVGRFDESDQFFLAHHVVRSEVDDSSSSEYLALYCFNGAGALTRYEIVGPFERATDEMANDLLMGLGPHEFRDICVSPFQVAFGGHIFGLVPDSKQGTINLEPGTMISFMEPWDGEYYT